MRIVLDLQACQTTGSRNRGMGRYTFALTQEIARQGGDHDVRLVLNGRFSSTVPEIRQAFDSLIPRDRITVFQVPSRLHANDPATAWRRAAAEAIRQHFLTALDPDIVHLSSLFEGLGDDAVTTVQPSNYLSSVTLYDLIPLVWKETYLSDPITRQWYFEKLEALKRAELLLAISEHSRREAISLLNLPEDRVINIAAAVDDIFVPQTVPPTREAELRARYGISRPFVMYTGGIDFRKNIESLIEAYGQMSLTLRSAYQLVIVCSAKDTERKRLQTLADKHGLSRHHLVLTGFVPDADLVALYNLCHLMVFPSLHEGFGLPVLEAMACGAAVIGSNTSSIPEVIGRKDALFDPARPAAIAAVMTRVLTDNDHRLTLRQYGLERAKLFSWKSSARRALQAFEDLHDRTRSNAKVSVAVSARRLRLAYLSPLPPAKSGIAAYSAELLPELARHYDIEVIVEQDDIDDIELPVALPVRHISWFEQNSGRFDRILYHFGNSHFHQKMFSIIARHPGVVVLHDFFLSGLLHWLDATGVVPGLFRRALYRYHGYAALFVNDHRGAEAAVLAYPANEAVTAVAVGVIVHSQFAFDSANALHGAPAIKDWRIVPQLHSLPGQPAVMPRRELGLSDESFLVCSFGIVDFMKANERLIDAFLASSLAHDPNCVLTFVGEVTDPAYRNLLTNLIDNSVARHRIKITGFVDTATYQAYLAAADVAVQLRRESRGETSRSALDALAYGLPLIVNACGPLTEIPNDCCIKLAKDFAPCDLAGALDHLRHDGTARTTLADHARAYIKASHDPTAIAAQYQVAIESLAATSARSRYLSLLSRLAACSTELQPSDTDLADVARALCANLSSTRQRQLLICVSDFDAQPTEHRNVLRQLLREPPPALRVEPIIWTGTHYEYAVEMTCRFLELPELHDINKIVDFTLGDHLVLTEEGTPSKDDATLKRIESFGVQIHLGLAALSTLLH